MVELETLARSPEEAAIRATLCMAVAMRGLLEGDAGGADQAEADTMRDQLRQGLSREERLWSGLGPEERELLETTVGDADPASADAAIWAAEFGQVLLWALERRELPAHDEQEHPFKVARSIGVISNVGGIPNNWLLLRSPRLRSLAEVCAQQRRLTAIRARLEHYTVDPAMSVDFAEQSAAPADVRDVPTRAGDLAIEDEPIVTAEPGAIANALAVASERQAGVDWLLGQALRG